MAGIKTKAASLVEIIIAMLILSISLSAAALVFMHFTDSKKFQVKESAEHQIVVITRKIRADSLFPESIQAHDYPNTKISVCASEFSDSIVKVKLIYIDTINVFKIQRTFFHAKN